MVTGLTPKTFERLQLNAGIFLKNFDYSGITTAAALATAVKAAYTSGTGLLGATRGGGTFSCTPEVRNIEVDGKRYEFKGSTIFDTWTVQMTGTLLEVTSGNLRDTLATGEVTTSGKVSTIRVRTDVAASDYIDHLVWIGDVANKGYMLIDLENALNTAGATMTFTDKGEGTLPFTFVAHQASVEDSDYAPVKVLLFEPGA